VSAETNGINRSERDSLLQVARLRARVAKDQVVAYAAKLKANFEQQLDAYYPWDTDEVWTEMAQLLEKTQKEAQERRLSARLKRGYRRQARLMT